MVNKILEIRCTKKICDVGLSCKTAIKKHPAEVIPTGEKKLILKTDPEPCGFRPALPMLGFIKVLGHTLAIFIQQT